MQETGGELLKNKRKGGGRRTEGDRAEKEKNRDEGSWDFIAIRHSGYLFHAIVSSHVMEMDSAG